MNKLPVHEGKILFECAACDLNFSSKEELNNHTASVHGENKLDDCGKNFSSVPDLKEPKRKKVFEFRYETAGDVTRIVRNLNNTKAIGVDGISTEVLKKVISVLASPMARICNLSMSTGIFPTVFKEPIVHPQILCLKGKGRIKETLHPIDQYQFFHI